MFTEGGKAPEEVGATMSMRDVCLIFDGAALIGDEAEEMTKRAPSHYPPGHKKWGGEEGKMEDAMAEYQRRPMQDFGKDGPSDADVDLSISRAFLGGLIKVNKVKRSGPKLKSMVGKS